MHKSHTSRTATNPCDHEHSQLGWAARNERMDISHTPLPKKSTLPSDVHAASDLMSSRSTQHDKSRSRRSLQWERGAMSSSLSQKDRFRDSRWGHCSRAQTLIKYLQPRRSSDFRLEKMLRGSNSRLCKKSEQSANEFSSWQDPRTRRLLRLSEQMEMRRFVSWVHVATSLIWSM